MAFLLLPGWAHARGGSKAKIRQARLLLQRKKVAEAKRVEFPGLGPKGNLATLEFETTGVNVLRGPNARLQLIVNGRYSSGHDNLITACGFSGHGLMHAPAVGRALAELALTGSYQTLDLSRLGFQRVLDGEPYGEAGIR